MSAELQPIDVTRSVELPELAEEVRRSGVGRLLKRGEQELAVLTLVTPRAARPHRRSPAAVEPDTILNIVDIGESAEPTDGARYEREYLADAYAPKPR